MDQALAGLIAAAATLVATHLALSHPLRTPVINAVGRNGFRALYSAIALASFVWLGFAFHAVPNYRAPLWNGAGWAAWILASLLTLLAAVLLVGSLRGNPALPSPHARAMAKERPSGVFRITRHPMMWSIAIWALGHVLVSPIPRVLILSLAMAFLALVGAVLQDGKKKDQLGSAWTRWEERTHFVPRLGNLNQVGPGVWLGGVALWLGATLAHLWLAGIPAGIWRLAE